MASHSIQRLYQGVQVWQMTYTQMDRPLYSNVLQYTRIALSDAT